MSLESKFSRLIPDAAKVHGEALLDASKIQLYRSGPTSALAESFGEDAQETTVQIENKELLADCSCELAQQGQLCGHVWATLLLSDRQGELQKAALQADTLKIFCNYTVPQVNRRCLEVLAACFEGEDLSGKVLEIDGLTGFLPENGVAIGRHVAEQVLDAGGYPFN